MGQLPLFSFEFFPPRTEEGSQNLLQTIKKLNKFDPEFFSVTFGAGGSTKEKTLETVKSNNVSKSELLRISL